MKHLHYTLLSALVLISAVLPLSAQTVWDGTTDTEWLGSGTEEDPYQIWTAEELAGLAEKVNTGEGYEGKYFQQKGNIYLNENYKEYTSWSTNPPANNWIPIGTEESPFAGTFDGYGIYGLYIKSDANYVGLFGYTGNTSEIHKTGPYINYYYVEGKDYVGAVVGKSKGKIGCTMALYGIVKGHDYVGGWAGYQSGDSGQGGGAICDVIGNSYVGGLFGYNSGRVITSGSQGTVTATGSNVGGLIGNNAGNLYRVFSWSEVNSDGGYVGGLIGINSADSVVHSYAKGDVTAPHGIYVGGLIGWTEGKVIVECSALGNIQGRDYYIGGLIGRDDHKATIRDCYATGNVTATESRTFCVAGLIGWTNADSVKNCYAIGHVDGDALTGQSYSTDWSTCYYNKEIDSSHAGWVESYKANPRTTAQMKLMRTYEGWDFENIWVRRDDTNNGYPELRSLPHVSVSENNSDPFVAVDSIAFVNLDDTYNEVDTINGIWIAVGERLNFTAKVFPEHANDQRVLWSVEDEWGNEINGFRLDTTYGEYNDYGEYNEYFGDSSHVYVYIEYYSGYNAYLIATSLDGIVSARCPIYVYEPTPVKSVSLNENKLTLYPNETFQLEATVLPEDAYDKSVYWSSSDYSVAEVSWEGIVTARKAGTATITVTTYDGNYTSTCMVQVEVAFTSLNIKASEITLNPGDFYYLNITYSPTDADRNTLIWKSGNPAVASVEQAFVEAISQGKTVVTVTTPDGTLEDFCTVTVVGEGVETKVDVQDIDALQVRKVFENGTIYIIRNGDKYTVDGRKL